MKKIVKKIEQQANVCLMPVMCGKTVSHVPTRNTKYTLSFTDGTEMTTDSVECDGRELKEGDEVYVYDDILSLKELSAREVAERKDRERKVELLVLKSACIFIIAMAIWLVMMI